MIFTNYIFGLFFVTTLLVYALVPVRFRQVVLIAAGFVFYAYDSIAHFLLLLTLTLVIYGLSNLRSRAASLVGITSAVGLLVFYKYSGLLVRTYNELNAGDGFSLPVPRFFVPLAISFFVFEFVHYLSDRMKGKTVGVGLRDFLLFIFFFPSLVAGPIKRIQSFEERVSFNWENVQAGITRMVIGLAKKSILGDSINPFFEAAFQNPGQHSALSLWVAMYAYALKIYFDFSGYSDMAIGAAQCFGYHLPENFNWPYLATNLVEFWRRWHISLSSWIRDYVYIPLGGNRRGFFMALLYMFIAMTISGLWHGANWTFVIWGMWHGLGQAVHKVWDRARDGRRLLPEPVARGLGWAVTFHFVCFGWVFFASPSLHGALLYLSRMLGVRS